MFLVGNKVSVNGFSQGEKLGIPTRFDIFPSNFGEVFHPGAKISLQTPPPQGNSAKFQNNSI